MRGLVIAVLTILVGTASNALAAVDAYLNIITVPEPSSLAVMAVGVGIAAFLRSRKRK